MASIKQTEQGAYLTLGSGAHPRHHGVFAGRDRQSSRRAGKTPIVVTSPIVRMYFKKMTEDYVKGSDRGFL